MSRHTKQRSLLIDALRALASILIVLHHLAFYGPMADHVRPVWPRLWQWMANDARMAVQVFLVLGGYLAARSLAPAGRLGGAEIESCAIQARASSLPATAISRIT